MSNGQGEIAKYLPHSILTTFLVAVAPLLLALRFTDSMVASLVVTILLSVLFSSAGSALWQRTEGSQDLVFDDLLLWGFLRCLRARRYSTLLTRRLQATLDPAAGMSYERRLRMLKKIAVSLESRDPYTHGHSQRVARHSYMVAKTMRLPRQFCRKVQLAGLLHDIGKLQVPKAILIKPTRLTDEEFAIIKTHPEAGAKLVGILGDQELVAMVRGHHERTDGAGYPHGAKGPEIPLGARIIAVADTFDAITSKRPYRAAQKHQAAIDILSAEAGTRLDASVVRAFRLYYRGWRSLSRWSLLITSLRHGGDTVMGFFARVGMSGVANAAVVGGAALAISAGGIAGPSRTDVEQEGKRSRTPIMSAASAAGNSSAAGTAPGSSSKAKGKSDGHSKGAQGKPDHAGGPKARRDEVPGASKRADDSDKGENGARPPAKDKVAKEKVAKEKGQEEEADTSTDTTDDGSGSDALPPVLGDTGPPDGGGGGKPAQPHP